MNPSCRRAPAILKDSITVWRQIFDSGNPARIASHLVLAVGGVLVVVAYFWLDQLWLDYASGWWRTTPLRADICGWISWHGDFFPFNLTIFAILFASGRLQGSRFLMRLAVVSLLSGALAGSVALITKSLSGRPRPRTVLRQLAPNPNEFRGPFLGANKKRADWESFPSGHTASAIGAAVPLVLAAPEIGVPVVCLSVCIGGSRLAGLNHYPSDVIAGASLGLFFGLRSGWSLRTLRRRLCSREGRG